MQFAKLHALGNDFLVVEDPPRVEEAELPEISRRMCDRHTGVGADGLLLLKQVNGQADRYGFRIFNADGSEAEISGNGLRCAAAYLFHRQRVNGTTVIFETVAGERSCDLVQRDGHSFELRTEMGEPRFSSRDIPFDDGQEHEYIIDYPLSISRRVYHITCVSVGNPHCDIFVERFFPARIEWHQVGQELEHHPFFPHRTNVEFIRVLNRQEIEVLFWERGVGETLSSGSGSCAAAVAAILKGLTERKVRVWTSMGSLVVEWEKDRIFQTGPAQLVFEGNFLG
ncbi:MAG: Diaminopimelate epimerase [Candidatus Saccharicenans subterraneus]|uniref:Diaminopimelate epimerase n=1 Tax=Candidatus Saccharicenans subterraneus TaxID=2508984 RepID=A0A3E2BKE6_9BACT|nr:MAG: Diaminopimelate epimerase [Candidatus Saccharicenans subterraneum]